MRSAPDRAAGLWHEEPRRERARLLERFAEVVPEHTGHPAAWKNPWASCLMIVWQVVPVAITTVSKVPAWARRTTCLNLATASSIGLQTGEERGRNQTSAPAAWIIGRACALFWTPRSSLITIWPGRSVGTGSSATYISDAARLSAPSSRTDGLIPVVLRGARSVMPCHRPRDTNPTARAPHGAQAYPRVWVVGVLVSSKRATAWDRRHEVPGAMPRALRHPARRPSGSFSASETELVQKAAHGRLADLNPMRLLP